jgi:BON domain
MLRKFAGLVAAVGMVVTVACGQTDAGITTNVKSKLAADDTVKAYQVDVDTQNHVVTLSGDVETSAAKERAIMLARETEGVTDVIDQIRVDETAATSGIGDNDLRIDRDTPDLDVDAPDIDVEVDDKLESDTRRGAEATKSGAGKAADATVEGAKKAGRATVEGAKKVGGAVRDTVTDDDPDTDRDGK